MQLTESVVVYSAQPVGSRRARTYQVLCGQASVEVLPERAERTYAYLQNLDATNTVFISPERAADSQGYPIPPHGTFPVTVSRLVFAFAQAGTPLLQVWEEYN